MTREVRASQVAVASALILAAPGCGTTRPASPALSAHVEPVSGPVVRLHSGPGQSPAAAIADAVQRAARAHFPGEYAGEVLVDHGFRVVVYLTRPTEAAETVITAGVQPGVVRFARAPRSPAFLNWLHTRVTAEQPRLKRRGTNLVRWGPDFITGRESITVQHLTAAKKAVLDSLFGTANLTLSSTASNVIACGCAAVPKHPGMKLRTRSP
jgi:hypothetical protein